MSVTVDTREVEPGNEAFLDDAWELKERIRERGDVLKQRRGFFRQAYRRATVYLYIEPDADDLIGFAAVRNDGYLLFLAVAPEYQGEGFGKRLVARVVEEHQQVSCHARTTNRGALSFYDHLGFEIVRRIDDYYEDGGDAYYLRLGENTGVLDTLSSLLRR